MKEIPSMEFCRRCQNKDIRVLQENYNELVLLFNSIANVLEIDGDIQTKIAKIKKWIKMGVKKNEKRKTM